MQKHYSLQYPLGYNSHWRSPEIPFYLSWVEVAEITRTGIYTDADGKKYNLPDEKEYRPIITYKGDFGARRNNDNFKGERSPFVVVDIDIAQDGLSKYNLTDDQRLKVDSDLEVMLDYLSADKRDFFFCKRSTSGCGLHIVVQLEGVPDGKIELYEREIILQFNKALKEISGLNYKYTADYAMMRLAQAMGLSKDEKVIYNPGRITSASTYSPKLEFGEQTEKVELNVNIPRPVHRFDRLNFQHFSRFCLREGMRLQYEDIFRLSLIFFQLWPEATEAEYIENCAGLNEARANEQRENSIRFLKGEYKKVRKALNRTYVGHHISIYSLYHIMRHYEYRYLPDKEIRFTGYLQSIEAEIFSAFDTQDKVLLQAPTGSGKTKSLFRYLKEMARKYPSRNFVLALPYISMVDQFCEENSDGEFEIGMMKGEEDDKDLSTQQATAMNTVFEMNDGSMTDGRLVKLNSRNKSKTKKGRKKKKVGSVIKPVPVFDATNPLEKRRNLWCTTYDSAIRIRNVHTLVIDEAHDTVSQVGFRKDAMAALEGVRCKRRIYITATPNSLIPETMEGFHYVKCIKEDKPKPRLCIERVKGSLTVATKNNISGKRSTLTFWNNKNEGEKLSSALLTEGIAADLYNRDTGKHFHMGRLKKEGIISTHAIATSYVSEGINVANEDIERINIVDDYSVTNILQASARPRKCVPEVKLILRETIYLPGVWKLSPVQMFIDELIRLEAIAKQLTGLRLLFPHNDHENLYEAYGDDVQYIEWSEDCYGYRVRESQVKARIMEGYVHWLYHKRRSQWMEELSEHFEVTETIVTDNEGKNSKKQALPFEAFRTAGHDLIMDFRAHKMKSKDRRRRKKEPYTAEMVKWAKENETERGNLEFTPEWERWTERYIKMSQYNAIDFDVIASGQKFCYWQRRADMQVSVREKGGTAKEKRIADSNRAIAEFLLTYNYNDPVINVSKHTLYHLVKNHIKSLGMKPIRLKERPFWASLKNLLSIRLRQEKITKKRFVKSIAIKKGGVKYTTGKLERLAKEAAKDREMGAVYGNL